MCLKHDEINPIIEEILMFEPSPTNAPTQNKLSELQKVKKLAQHKRMVEMLELIKNEQPLSHLLFFLYDMQTSHPELKILAEMAIARQEEQKELREKYIKNIFPNLPDEHPYKKE